MYQIKYQSQLESSTVRTRILQLFLSLKFKVIVTLVLIAMQVVLFVPIILVYLYVNGVVAIIVAAAIASVFTLIMGCVMLFAIIQFCCNKFTENFQIRLGIIVNVINGILSVVDIIVTVSFLFAINAVGPDVGFYMYYAFVCADIGIFAMLLADLILYDHLVILTIVQDHCHSCILLLVKQGAS